MRHNYLLAITAFVCEAVSLFFLYDTFFKYITAHTLASMLMALFSWQLMQHPYREPKRWVMLWLFVWCFFLPVLGIAGLFLAVIVIYWSPKTQEHPLFVAISPPVYRISAQATESSLHIDPIREQLMSDKFTTEIRMKALLAIQHMPTHHTAGVLRAALTDHADDLRLLAYGMLEARERELMLRVQNALLRQQRHEDQYSTTRELAELYWEMVYQQLVQGDMRRFALEQVSNYAQEALKLNPKDGGLWVIFGRMHLINGDYSAAEKAFSTVVSLGFLVMRTEPYLAELAFLRKDYHTVRHLMSRNLSEGRLPQPRQVAVYWRNHENHE